jgi:hypothetical protein
MKNNITILTTLIEKPISHGISLTATISESVANRTTQPFLVPRLMTAEEHQQLLYRSVNCKMEVTRRKQAFMKAKVLPHIRRHTAAAASIDEPTQARDPASLGLK